MQKTIKKEIIIKGKGLNTGKEVKVKFLPAPVNSGINFVRTDLPEKPVINANLSNVVSLDKSLHHTSLGDDKVQIQTIEHLMASLNTLGIDNVFIEINGEELPAMDGSSSDYFKAFTDTGFSEQDSARKTFQVRETIWCAENGAMLMALPARNLRVSYTLYYDHPLIQCQYIDMTIDADTFGKEIAPSRTFCLEEEVKRLMQEGLGKGASHENTLVMGKKGVIKNKLRFENEFARHKVLDLLGDMNLLGFPVKAHFVGIKSGHALNMKLLEKIKTQRQKTMEGGIMAQGIPDISGGKLDINQIQKILPHRYPFLLVDRILEIEPKKRAVGIKNVTANEHFFVGHFPGHPVMPGVLIIEAMAQVAGVLMLSEKANIGKMAYFMGINNVKFRKTVVPGDQLLIEVEVLRLKTKTGQVRTVAKVDGNIVTEAELMFSLVDA